MADLNDRGQIILVTGFAIAVAIVALVLLLNTAIYTENLATRAIDTDPDEALAYRDTVADTLWPVVAGENEKEYASRATLRANVRDRIDRFVTLSSRRHLLGGASANVTNRTLHDGTWLRQPSARELTNASGGANWTMATNARDVRQFEINTTGGLYGTGIPADQAFNVTVVGASDDQWSLYVYEESSNYEVAVRNASGPMDQNVCGGPFSDPPRVNLTAGTVNGAPCDELVFAKGTSPPYDVRITFGNRAEGTYDATVNTTTVGDFNGPGPAAAPYEVPVVYSLSADVVYRTPDLSYRVRLHLAEADEP